MGALRLERQPWLFVYHDDPESLANARALLNPNNQRWAT